ncbi:MAG TPA: hypothetical protein DIW30_06735 [Bacteroidales bacterium]|nr:hypothetical protein [Bacteroidales bacterium]
MKTSTKIWMCLAGIALVALGVVCLIYPSSTMLSLAWVLGLIFLVAGCCEFAAWGRLHAILPQSGLLFLSALLQVLMGIFCLVHPLSLAAALPFIFAFVVIFEGIRIAVESFDFKQVGFRYWWLMLLFGILATAFGVYGLFQPVASATTLTILVSLGIMLAGVGYWVRVAAINRFQKKFKQLHDRFGYVDAEEVK